MHKKNHYTNKFNKNLFYWLKLVVLRSVYEFSEHLRTQSTINELSQNENKLIFYGPKNDF